MKRSIWLFLFLLIFIISGCAQKRGDIEKFVEDGIEVIINKVDPYQLPEMSQPAMLEEELVIDLEDEAVIRTGLFRIDTFCVDDEGNIYILTLRSDQNHIYKFSPEGKFITSFGQNGKGPGEIARPVVIMFTLEKELMVTDSDNAKLLYFTQEGSLLREVVLRNNVSFVYPLSNGNAVVFGRIRPDPEQRNLQYPLELCDEYIEPLKTLDTFPIENFRVTDRMRGTQPGFGLAVGGGWIYIGNETRDYEIWAFDQSGALVRKIRKDYEAMPVTQEIKDEALSRFSEQMRPVIFFPDLLPPFRTMTADENGTLFIVNFEPGDEERENRIDIFNPEGVFIGRLSAAVFIDMGNPISLVARKGHFYYIRETDTGFKQLVVERIVFE